MHVARCNGHFTESVRTSNDAFIDIDQIFLRSDTPIHVFTLFAFFGEHIFLIAGSEHKFIVAVRLYFKIIIKRGDLVQFLIRCAVQDCLIHFALFAGGADHDPVSVLPQN